MSLLGQLTKLKLDCGPDIKCTDFITVLRVRKKMPLFQEIYTEILKGQSTINSRIVQEKNVGIQEGKS